MKKLEVENRKYKVGRLAALAVIGLMLVAGFAGCIGGEKASYAYTTETFITKIRVGEKDLCLKINAFSDDTIKIHFSKNDSFKQSSLEKYGFINEGRRCTLKIQEIEKGVLVYCGENTLKIERDPFYMSINGKSVLEVALDSSTESTSGNISMCTFKSDPDEHFFGLGQKFSSVDQKGKVVLQHIKYGNKDNQSLSGVPFFISTQDYGIFVDTTYRTIFDFQNQDKYSILTDDDNLRLFYIRGNDFKSILQDYTNITGKPPLPPKWMFGYLQSKYGYSNRVEFEDVASKMREMDFPCDGLILDYFWRDNGGLEWYEPRFPEHQQMIEKLTGMGYKIVLHEDTATTKVYQGKIPWEWLYYVGNLSYAYDYSVYPFYYGAPVPIYNISILDVTCPPALDWYWGLHLPLMYEGIDAFWIDEVDRLDEDCVQPLYNGMLPPEAHNLYPNLFNKNIFEGMEREGTRGAIITRSIWAGSQRYPWVWSGDIDCSFTAMKEQIIAGQTMGLSGVPFWSNDLGGFWGEWVGAALTGGPYNTSNPRGLMGQPSDELQIRWTAQFGAFCPMMRAHGTGWWMEFSIIGGREPWQFNETAQKIFRFYDKLRYQLIPYIYSCAYESTQTGLPIMRALVLEFPDDKNCYNKDTEYMFGQAFLVAPICEEGGRERTVYLPEGTWIDFWTNQIYEGPVEINYPAPLEILPLFVRAGSIIPTGPVTNYIDEKPLDPLVLWVYPQDNGTFNLYEDDGISLDYMNGVFAVTPMKLGVEGKKILFQSGEKIGEYKVPDRAHTVIMKGVDKPQSVKVNGEDWKDWKYYGEGKELTINVRKISQFEIVVER